MPPFHADSRPKRFLDYKTMRQPADFETAIAQTGYGKYNYLLMTTAFIGILGNMSGSTAVSYILPAAQCDLNLTNFEKGTINAMIYGGSILSPLIWGFLSDNLGRQKLLVVGFLVESLCSIISSLAQSLWHLQLFRFLVGFVGCGPGVIIFTYLAEFHAAQYRSRVIVATSFFVSVSFIFAPALAWLLLPQPWSWAHGSFKLRSWNIFLFVCSLPSFITGILLMLFPESPKFLMSRGEQQKAMKVFQKLYSVNTGRKPDAFPVKELVDELNLENAGPTSVGSSSKSVWFAIRAGWRQIEPLFTTKHFPMLALLTALQFGLMIAINTLRLWVPQIFSMIQEFFNKPETQILQSSTFCEIFVYDTLRMMQNSSITEEIPVAGECTVYVADSWIYITSIIIGASCGVCVVAAGFLINALGAKWLMIPSFLVSGLSVLGIIWSQHVNLTMALFSIMQGFMEISICGLIAVTVGVFPTTIRVMALNFVMLFGRIGSLTGNLTFPLFLDLNCASGFLAISVILIACGAGSFWIPSTKMKALE